MTADQETMAYAGVLPCGCIPNVTIDMPEYQKDNAREIAAWMRQGMSIDHRTVAEIKADPAFLRNCHGEYHHREARRRASDDIRAGL